MVELHARRAGLELVRESTAWIDDLEDAVHLRRMDPVEVDRVRVRSRVDEVHVQRSPSVARITGPGAVPLYIHAGKKTPGATSSSVSVAVSVYSRRRPGS